MSETTNTASPGTPRAAAETPEQSHDPAVCPVAWCPVCLAVSTMQPVAPDVVEHLIKAGTEMFLAFRALIESRAADLDGSVPEEPVRLEKIDIG
jgi:hypothetical protein